MTTALLIVDTLMLAGIWLAVADIRAELRRLRRHVDELLPVKARY